MSVKYTYSFGKTGLNLFNANNVLLLPNIYVTLTKHSENLLKWSKRKSLSSKLSFHECIGMLFAFRYLVANIINLSKRYSYPKYLFNHTFILILTYISSFLLIRITAPSWMAIFHMNYYFFFTFKDLCLQKKASR